MYKSGFHFKYCKNYQYDSTGLKIDLSSSTADSEEASALGHLSDAIMVYSNSWGPSDYGFSVDGPGVLTELTFSTGAQNVSLIITCYQQSFICHYSYTG